MQSTARSQGLVLRAVLPCGQNRHNPSTFSFAPFLHCSGVWGRGVRAEPKPPNPKTRQNSAKRNLENPEPCPSQTTKCCKGEGGGSLIGVRLRILLTDSGGPSRIKLKYLNPSQSKHPYTNPSQVLKPLIINPSLQKNPPEGPTCKDFQG